MRRAVGLAALVALAALLALGARGEEPSLPPLARGITSKRSKLTAVFGDYGRRFGAGVESLQALPGGEQLACLERDLVLIDAKTGGEKKRLRFGKSPLKAAVSPDGTLALIAWIEQPLELWSLAKGERLRTLATKIRMPDALAFSPDGALALVASSQQATEVWDVAKGELVGTLAESELEPGKGLMLVAFADGGRTIVGVGLSFVRRWKTQTREVTGSSDCEGYPLAITPAGRFALLQQERSVVLLELASSKVVKSLPYESDVMITNAALSPDGRRALVSTPGEPLELADFEKGTAELIDTDARYGACAFAGDADHVFANRRGVLVRLDLATKKPVFYGDENGGPIIALALSPDGERFVTATSLETTLLVRDARTGAPDGRIEGHASRPVALAFSPQGALLSADREGGARLTDFASRKLIRALPETKGARTVAFSKEGDKALVGGADKKVRLFSVATGELLAALDHGAEVAGLALLDEKHLVSVGLDATVKVWDWTKKTTLRAGTCTDPGHDSFQALAFAPDGASFVRGVVRFDVATGESLWLPTLDFLTFAAAVAPDGRSALTGLIDRTIHWVALSNGEERDRIDLAPSGDTATSLAFAPDGRSFLAGTNRGVVLRFETGDKK